MLLGVVERELGVADALARLIADPRVLQTALYRALLFGRRIRFP